MKFAVLFGVHGVAGLTSQGSLRGHRGHGPDVDAMILVRQNAIEVPCCTKRGDPIVSVVCRDHTPHAYRAVHFVGTGFATATAT